MGLAQPSHMTEQVLGPTASRMGREVSGAEVDKSLPGLENKNGPERHNKHQRCAPGGPKSFEYTLADPREVPSRANLPQVNQAAHVI